MPLRKAQMGALALVVSTGFFVFACSSSDNAVVPGDGAGSPLTSDAAADGTDDASAADDSPPQPTCDEYCGKVMSTCTGAFGAPGSHAQYASMDGCQNLCNQIGSGDYTDMAGNDSLGCRLNQLKAGASACAAGGPTGGGVCNSNDADASDGGRCATFCNMVLSLCTKDNGVDPQPYADTDACMAACGTKFRFDSTQPELTQNGNTLNCRQGRLVLAFDGTDGGSAVYECPHLGFPASAFCQ